MKNLLLVLLLHLPLAVCYGQKTEISIQASSGLSFYGGQSATSTPTVFINDVGPPFYQVSSPYSNKSDLPYGFAVQVQRVSSKNLLFGLRLGYDTFSTISHFDSYGAMGGRSSVENGTIQLQNNLIYANPYLGYRLGINTIHLDVVAGINAGSIRKSTYSVSFDGQPAAFDEKVDNYLLTTKMDFGPTIGLATEYRRVGIQVSYCHGIVNYMRNLDYLPKAQAYSRYLRLGVSYRIM
ncbi:hypothetical protein [Telluribacter sp.]|jgi:hypothetical protein|uniref:hypothetical protein n=1 Tax=Telluribacter sp. TaxID=1978767 RepID=UPI002E107C4A|nr:hypothetical protein [Telluribacter sp.]